MNFRKALVIGAILVSFWVIVLCYFVHYGGTRQQQLILIGGFGAMLTGFAWNKVARFLRLRRLELRGGELVIVYAMLLSAIPLCALFRGAIESGVRNLHPEMAGRLSYAYARKQPWMAVQSAEAIEGYYLGPKGAPGFLHTIFRIVPWSDWSRPILYWGATLASFQLAALCLILILRKKWVEEDRLPYPWAQIPAEFALEREARSAPEKKSRLGLAYVIGLGICVPGLVGTVFEQFQSPIGVPVDVIGFGRDLTALEIVPGVEFNVVLEPFAILTLLFLPLDVALSMFLTFCGLLIVFPWFLESFVGVPGYAGKIYLYVMYVAIRMGGLAGLTIWSMWFARKQLPEIRRRATRLPAPVAAALGSGGRGFFVAGAGTAAGAFRGWISIILPERPESGVYAGAAHRFLDGLMRLVPDRAGALPWADWKVFLLGGAMLAGVGYLILRYPLKGPWNEWLRFRGLEPADEEGEPASYRLSVLGFLLFGALFAVLAGLGQAWDLALLAFAMIVVANFTYARIRAEGAYPIYPPWHMLRTTAQMQHNYLHLWQTEEGWNSMVKVGEFGVTARCVGPQTHLMEAFKLASDVGTKGRWVLKAVLASMGIVFALTAPVFLAFAYKYGVERTSVEGTAGKTWAWWVYHGGWGTRRTPRAFGYMMIWFLIGVAVTGLLMYLRREYARFPLSPVGCFLGATIGGYSDLGTRQIWASVLVAYFIKLTIFKWYGVRTFRKGVLPYVIHCVMGILTGMVLYMLIWAFRGQGVWL